jgi:DNA-binding NarL/FixJ family response regulator
MFFTLSPHTFHSMKTQTITCVVVDDERASASLLSDYISTIPYLSLKMAFQNPVEALVYLLKNPVDLLITDLMMPRLTGVQLYESIAMQLQTQVIFVTAYADKATQALQYSVVDYLLKPIPLERFEQATSKALKLYEANQKVTDTIPTETQNELTKLKDTIYEKLTRQEIKVIKFTILNYSNKEIASQFGISESTVKVHKKSICKKFNIVGQLEFRKFLKRIDEFL